jgi:Domain of unknown function (DUF3859)
MGEIMRVLLALLLATVGWSAAQAQSGRIDRIDALKPGIFVFGDTPKSIQDRSISTGQRTEAKEIRNVEVTTLIPARKDTVFGVEGMVVGSPNGASVPVRVVWRYPEPGLTNPDTGITKYLDDYTERRTIGQSVTYYWNLGSEWTLVPGVWTLELYQGERLLLTQRFTLVRP